MGGGTQEQAKGSAVLGRLRLGKGLMGYRGIPYSSSGMLYLRQYLSDTHPQSLPRAVLF